MKKEYFEESSDGSLKNSSAYAKVKVKQAPERTGVIRSFDLGVPGTKIGLTVVYILCAALVLIALFPVFWVIMAGFKDLRELNSSTAIFPSSFDFSQYTTTWDQSGISRTYLNSFYVVAGSIACALVVNGMLAYGLAILKPAGYKLIGRLVMLSLLTPATISLVPLFMNIQRVGMGGFFWPLWLAAGANAFFVVLFRQFFESLPFSIIEASRIDGCSPLQTFFQIVMPLSKPIVVVITLYTINAAWSDFLLPYLVLGNSQWQTVMVRLFILSTQQTINDAVVLRTVVFSMIPPILLFFIFQKKLTENAISVGIKG
ncbi:MAG: carbohydrate ABC transporter permease [Oscillospiraceae bacterium]|nr:carbohydrate ABC transporter permease [Oscillospiraceae bacterium]